MNEDILNHVVFVCVSTIYRIFLTSEYTELSTTIQVKVKDSVGSKLNIHQMSIHFMS